MINRLEDLERQVAALPRSVPQVPVWNFIIVAGGQTILDGRYRGARYSASTIALATEPDPLDEMTDLPDGWGWGNLIDQNGRMIASVPSLLRHKSALLPPFILLASQWRVIEVGTYTGSWGSMQYYVPGPFL